VRWYRRLSRERAHREVEGAAIATRLAPLRAVGTIEGLRQRYAESHEDWDATVLGRASADAYRQSGRYRAEDAACGLRWLEITAGMLLDLHRSLTPQIPSSVLDRMSLGRGTAAEPCDGIES
jgi:hypothetical protein